MTLRKYKYDIKKILVQLVGMTDADILMNIYKDDFQSFLDMNWSSGTAVMAMLMGY